LVRDSISKLAEHITRDGRQGRLSSQSLCERIGEQHLTVKGAATALLTSGIRRRTVAILSQRLMDRAQPPECWSTIDVGLLRAVDLTMAPANKLRMDERTMPEHSSHKEKPDMSTDENKAVVRRFITEVLSGGNIDLIDELLAPNYVNPGMGNADREGFKGMLAGMKAAMPVREFTVGDLVAEGDAVVYRGTVNFTLADGKQVPARVTTFYRLADGKIVEDDPITSPDLAQTIMGGAMPAPA
jgi:predicted SnoaL-like aldol condensation-catalyzing enzyme